MSVVVENNITTFITDFDQCVYNLPNQSCRIAGQLATNTAGTGYQTGQLLGLYNANVAAGATKGQWVNYSAASANADQKVPVGILVQPNMAGPNAVGILGNNGNYYDILPLVSGVMISASALASANLPADVTAFLTAVACYTLPAGSNLTATNDTIYVIK